MNTQRSIQFTTASIRQLWHIWALNVSPFTFPFQLFMVALCVTQERPSHFTWSFFSQTRFLCRLSTNFLQTLPHDVGSSAIENVSSKFCYMPLKEIRGQKHHLWEFFGHCIKILQHHFVVQKIYDFKTTAYKIDVHSLCTKLVRGRDLQ